MIEPFKFYVVSGDDWKRSIAYKRSKQNQIKKQIRDAIDRLKKPSENKPLWLELKK
jgi:hypothetical protein